MNNDNTIETKTFKLLYPNYLTFQEKIWNPMSRLLTSLDGDIPKYIDENEMFYLPDTLYQFFYNKYSEFSALNDDDKQHALMINAFVHTLPSLYAKTQMLTKEALELITPEGLLKNLEERFNEDPDNKFASTETAYSSTPDASQALKNFNVENIKEKNVINRKDATKRIKQTTNLLTKLKDLSEINISGFIYELINSVEFSSLWEYYNGDSIIIARGMNGTDGMDGANGTDGTDGTNGTDGTDGTDGVDGYITDAAELAVETAPLFRDFDTTTVAPIRDQANIIGTNTFVDETGTSSQFDDTGNTEVYTSAAVNDLIRNNSGANTDLSNVNVKTINADKILTVAQDGTITYTDPASGGTPIPKPKTYTTGIIKDYLTEISNALKNGDNVHWHDGINGDNTIIVQGSKVLGKIEIWICNVGVFIDLQNTNIADRNGILTIGRLYE